MMGSDSQNGRGDLGRRIAEQRTRAGLSRAEAAEQAGMAPDYLEYLETSPAPNPGRGAVTRLAAVLGTTAAALGGAGMLLPPGERGAARRPVLEVLSTTECRTYLAPGGVGRFLFTAARGPVAMPVNYRMLGDDIIFRTTVPTSAAAAGPRRVSFEVDHLDGALSEGWSVLVSGEASPVTAQPELDKVTALAIDPWAGGDRDVYIRIVASEITGRRIRAVET
jgi:nitroimidazol reductase NimA-like FMN-containing flavoprotein (pyridoxamine 5'-phosphate oxidase superfamily)